MDSDTQNFYEILGVDRKATQAEIKKTFMKLAKENHPDKTSSLPEAERERREALFKQINEANETLSDPDKHAKYDFDLDNPKPQHAGPAASPVGRSPENFWRDPGRGSRGSRSGAHDNLYMELEDEFVKMFQRFEADRNNRFDGTGNPHGSRSSWQPKGPHLFRDEGRVPREPDLFQTNKHTEHSLDGTTSVWSFSLKFPSKRLKIYFQSRPRWYYSADVKDKKALIISLKVVESKEHTPDEPDLNLKIDKMPGYCDRVSTYFKSSRHFRQKDLHIILHATGLSKSRPASDWNIVLNVDASGHIPDSEMDARACATLRHASLIQLSAPGLDPEKTMVLRRSGLWYSDADEEMKQANEVALFGEDRMTIDTSNGWARYTRLRFAK